MSTDSYCSRNFSSVFYMSWIIWVLHTFVISVTSMPIAFKKHHPFSISQRKVISCALLVLEFKNKWSPQSKRFLPVMVQQPAGPVSSPGIAGIVHKLSISVCNMFPCSQHATGRSDVVGIFNACLFSASNIWTIGRRAWLCSRNSSENSVFFFNLYFLFLFFFPVAASPPRTPLNILVIIPQLSATFSCGFCCSFQVSRLK